MSSPTSTTSGSGPKRAKLTKMNIETARLKEGLDALKSHAELETQNLTAEQRKLKRVFEERNCLQKELQAMEVVNKRVVANIEVLKKVKAAKSLFVEEIGQIQRKMLDLVSKEVTSYQEVMTKLSDQPLRVENNNPSVGVDTESLKKHKLDMVKKRLAGIRTEMIKLKDDICNSKTLDKKFVRRTSI